jgi:alpha-galactosidase
MSIDFKDDVFRLRSKSTSYLFCIIQNRYICHLYWGKRLELDDDLKYLPKSSVFSRASGFSPPNQEDSEEDRIFNEDLQFEFSIYGCGDYSIPSFHAQYADGSTVSELEYAGYRIMRGKPVLAGLPATYAEDDSEAETLEIEFTDRRSVLKAYLSYTVFEEYDAITRSVRYENTGEESIRLLNVYSACVDFPGMDYKMLHLYGVWAGERNIEISPLRHGMQSISSTRGMSGHAENPFLALMDRDTSEYSGDVYGFSLIYSGNFSASCEVSTYERSRVMIGINPFEFTWKLKSGCSFQTPEAVLAYSSQGIDSMSRIYHRLYRQRLCRGRYRDTVRPLIANNWEGTAYDFNEEKILGIASVAKEAGIELFVLDDGWFGKRDDETSSLGDWFVYRKKLPGGIEGLSAKIHAMGMKFGLWFEPEMISPDSDLYRAHPDWCIHVNGRKRTTGRHQLILDLTREDVRDYVVGAVSKVINSAQIDYIKWDCNRNFTETGSALLPAENQCEVFHRYVLGLYDILERLTQAFPDILFESCSGGGGRFDAGMLYYMPQTWTSDNTDAVERMFIQYGTSVVYPAVTMGAHVSSRLNITTGRTIPIETRAAVAMSGNFGLELDLTKLGGEEITEIKEQVSLCKKYRNLIQFGDLHRLENPFQGRFASWEFVSTDKNEVVAFFFQVSVKFDAPERRVKLRGLLQESLYQCDDGSIYSGEVLMNVGLRIPFQQKDYASEIKSFRVIT